MTPIYKICTASEWAEAERAGAYRGSAVDCQDGFIIFPPPSRPLRPRPSGSRASVTSSWSPSTPMRWATS